MEDGSNSIVSSGAAKIFADPRVDAAFPPSRMQWASDTCSPLDKYHNKKTYKVSFRETVSIFWDGNGELAVLVSASEDTSRFQVAVSD